jgi:hypothetical protein
MLEYHGESILSPRTREIAESNAPSSAGLRSGFGYGLRRYCSIRSELRKTRIEQYASRACSRARLGEFLSLGISNILRYRLLSHCGGCNVVSVAEFRRQLSVELT